MIKRLMIAVAMLCAVTEAQVPVTPISQPRVTFVNASGGPCAGCTLSSFAAGTTTPLATYTDSTGVSQNTNPVILDAAGGAFIWLGANSYKLILKDPSGATIWSVDHINSAQLLPCATANAIQSANSAVNALTCDPSITINTTSHTINIGTMPANHVIIGALGTPTLWTFDTTSPATALASLNGNTAAPWANPLAFGATSNGSTFTVTASGAAGAITLSALSDFVAKQGIMIAHAGAACGTVKGGGCAAPPTPAATTAGTAGSTTYTYKLACIDGLGGVGVAGSGGGTSTGNATLAGVVKGTTLSGNYNVVTWTGNGACFEVAIYRNSVLIATEYSAPSGTMVYNDMGVTAWTNRDIPSAPQTTALNDNYVGIIQTLTGTTATVSPNLGATITASTLYHSDSPLFQAAINSSSFVEMSAGKYLINYPLNYTRAGATVAFGISGTIRGPGTLLMDTGDIGLDVTGDDNITLSGFTMNNGPTNPTAIGIYCARDTTLHGGIAQNVMTESLILSIGQNAHALGGRGAVGFYNHACEIQHNFDDQFQVDRWTVLTSSNRDYVSSLFDANDDRSTQSMSQVDFYSANGGSFGVFTEIDNAYTVNFYGGYGNGGWGASHPWAFEVDAGQAGRLNLDHFRVELKGGLIDVAAGAVLREPYLNSDVYRSDTILPLTPQIHLNNGASLQDADMVRSDDYGGSGSSTSITALVDGVNCTVFNSVLRVGVWENTGTCPTTGAGNIITGDGGDWSLPPNYNMTASPSGTTWVKLGTWKFHFINGGNTLDIRFSTGAGFDPGFMDQPAIADVIIRTGNNTSAPNISAASLMEGGKGSPPLTGLKVVATGGSTSVTNNSWDVYVNEAVFATGSYQVIKATSDEWININALTADPGTGATIVVGTLYNTPIMTTTAPSGTCTLNGFIPTILNGVTVNVAICN